MAAENSSVEHTSLPSQEIGLSAPERPLYTESAVALIDAIKAHIIVTPVYVSNEANSDSAGIPFPGGTLVPVAFYQGSAMNYCPDESYLPSSAHPEPHELKVEKEIHGYMRNIAGLACQVAAAEQMQEWWSRQDGLEARAQQLAQGVRATALFSQLQFAEANRAWAEHARDYRNRAPRSVAQALRVDLDELRFVKEREGKQVTNEDIETLLAEYRQQGLPKLFEEVDLSEMSDDTLSAPSSKAKSGGIPFSPPFTEATVSMDSWQTHSAENAAVRIAELTMLLAPAFAACQNAPTPIPLTPIPQGATEVPGPTNPSPVIPEALEVATPLPGGPDDEQVIANTLPWPSSISDITEDLPAAGGPYNIVDVDAPNVRKQFDGVKSLLIRSGFTVTSVDNAPHLVDKQVLLSPVENGKFGDKAQWAIAGITNKGFVIPVDKDGTVMDRPDWATSNVAKYAELADGYGPEYQRFWEEYNGHWVPVVRDVNGKLVAFYDINKGEFVRNIMTPEPSATPTLTPTPDTLREFSQLNISFPDRLQEESNKDGFRTSVVLSEDLMKNTGITDLNIPQDQLDQIGKYILGVAMWGNRTANSKLSAFAQLPNLDVSGDKVVALSEPLLTNGQNVELSFSDGQRTIKGPVSSLQMMFVTLAESDKIFKTIQEGSAQYVDDEFVNTRANSRFRILLFMNNNQLTVVHASNSPGIEMPFSGGAKYRIAFEAYLNAGMRNNTERLVDFSTMLYFINETLVRFAPAHDDYRQAFINYAAPYPISNFLCSGTWDRDLAFKNNTYWRGEGGKLKGCDPAATKLFSPKAP